MIGIPSRSYSRLFISQISSMLKGTALWTVLVVEGFMVVRINVTDDKLTIYKQAGPAAASVTSHHTIIDGHHLQVRSEHAESLQCNGVLPTHRRSWQAPFPMSRRGQKAPSTLPTLYCIYTIHFIRLKRAIALYASVRWPSNKQREIE
jgi:hypothetical protein